VDGKSEEPDRQNVGCTAESERHGNDAGDQRAEGSHSDALEHGSQEVPECIPRSGREQRAGDSAEAVQAIDHPRRRGVEPVEAERDECEQAEQDRGQHRALQRRSREGAGIASAERRDLRGVDRTGRNAGHEAYTTIA
jgi:hypothetical protein